MSKETTLLRNPVATWTDSTAPSRNHADAKNLWVKSGERFAWVHFNRPFPLGATIVSATLRLYARTAWNASPTITVKRVAARWGVNRLTWNNQPAVGAQSASLSQNSTKDDQEWAFDVTAHMQRVSDGGVWYGFRIESSGTTARSFHSDDTAAGTRPQLEVVWSEAPQAPDTLSPSGSRAVSIAKPVLRFDFTDRRGSTALQAVHVQIDPTGNWTTPAFDSGTVLATEPELDLADFTAGAGAVGTVSVRNLVANPSFEVDTAQWQGTTGTISRIVGTSKFGTAYCRVEATTTNGGARAETPAANYVPVAAGETVTLSSYVIREVGTRQALMRISWRDAAGAEISVSTGPAVTPTTDWTTRASVTGTAPANAVSMRWRLEFATTGAIGDRLGFDGVLAERSSTVGTYGDGATPGWAWTSTPHASTSGPITYAGLSANTETRWRVRVQDGAGLWSEWSDVARFRRDLKGTLSISNPGAAPNDFVSEWTPPIFWALTGETQKAWQVIVTPADDHTDHLYDTGRTKGADSSWTLPRGILEDDARYRLVVRIWDTKDREHNPGAMPDGAKDRVYTQAVREFAFREDPTVNPVTNLAVDNLLPRPWAELTWDRATAPDRFVVKRNGRVIEPDLDPAERLVSGTTYRWVDRDAHPFRNHTWVVQAVANGKTSAGNPSVAEYLYQQGIWLSDNERDIDVFINGRDEGTWSMGEEATTHHPVGATHGVRITQAMRGLEGTITGELTDDAGRTAEQWEERLLRIKARPGNVLTLSLGNESLRCVIGNLVVHPTPTLPITKAVSFDFWQVGRLSYKPRL